MARDAGGRFARISPVWESSRPIPATITTGEARLIVRDVANLPVIIRDARERRRIVSFFEAAVWRIATGQVSRRNSPIPFVKLALEAARGWPRGDGHADPGSAAPKPPGSPQGEMGTDAKPVEFDELSGYAAQLVTLIKQLRKG